MKAKKFTCLFLILFVFIGCAVAVPRTARLYDLNTGIVIEGFINNARQNYGKITAENRTTGERFTGEYTSIAEDRVSYSFLSSSGYGWATAYGFSFNQPRKIFGAATLIGNKGTIIEIVYAVDRRNLHGHGVGRDNKGNRYRVHF